MSLIQRQERLYFVCFSSDFHHAGDIFVAEVAGTVARLCVCQEDAAVSDFSNFLCRPRPAIELTINKP